MNGAHRILINILWGLIVAVVVGLSAGMARGAALPDGPCDEPMRTISVYR